MAASIFNPGMVGSGGGSGTENRTARFVADFEVFKLDFSKLLFSLLFDVCESDLTDELLDCGAVEAGVDDKESLN